MVYVKDSLIDDYYMLLCWIREGVRINVEQGIDMDVLTELLETLNDMLDVGDGSLS